MNRFICTLCALIVLLSLAGCKATSEPTDAAVEETVSVVQSKTAAPMKALDKIYESVDIIDVNKGNLKVLNDKFFIGSNYVDEAYFNYTSGRFGVADVFILKPAKDQSSQVKELLQQVKAMRVKEFSSYDIYNSAAIAEEAPVFEQGGYIILLMLEDTEAAREIINEYIPVN